MKRTSVEMIAVSLLLSLVAANCAEAQVGVFSRQDLIEYTPLWKGERFADGRPKVPDDLLKRMKAVSIEEAWAVCRRHGHNCQFEGNWVITGEKPVLVGRAVTACFHPVRPDVNKVIQQKGKQAGRIGGQNSWAVARR